MKMIAALTAAVLFASALSAEAQCRCRVNSHGKLVCVCKPPVLLKQDPGGESGEKSVARDSTAEAAIELTEATPKEQWLRTISELVLQGDTADAEGVLQTFHETFPSHKRSEKSCRGPSC